MFSARVFQNLSQIDNEKVHDDGQDTGERDAPYALPRARAVEFGGLVQFGRHGRERREIENGPPAQFLPDVCNDDDGNEPVGIGQYARTRAQPGAQKPLFVQKRVGDGVNDDPTEKVRDIDDRLHHFLRAHHAHIVQKDGQKQGRGRRADEF